MRTFSPEPEKSPDRSSLATVDSPHNIKRGCRVFGLSNIVARRLKRLIHNQSRIAIVLALVVCTINTATPQGLQPFGNLTSIDPSPAPGFAGAQWINNLSANDDFLKGKVVLVNFWATWCPPCIKELPTIQKLWSSLDRSKFEVVAVNVGEKPATVQKFLDNFDPNLEFAIVLDTELEVYKSWGVRPVPTTYFVDRENNRRYKGLGEFDFDSVEFRSLIQQLIQENSSSG